jgi:predicted O-methyltransferase YrrM
MNTLTTPPLSDLLQKLFADADASTAALERQRTTITPEQRAAPHSPSADYRAFYMRLKDAHLAVSPETGKLLYVLARSIKARSIVEFGTSFGISTLHLAAALRDNGGGRVIGS